MLNRRFGALWLALVGAFTVWLAPTDAEARWLRAESARFIVYSDGDEQTLRRNVRDLEHFDRLLRGIHGLDLDGVPPRKLEIYLLRGTQEMDILRPGWGGTVAGYYSSGVEDIYAVGIRERRSNQTLLHEYVHHFMLQNFHGAYPAWLVEGYAEFFSATEFDDRGVTFGMPLDGRSYSLLRAEWLPLEQVVGAARPARMTLATMDAYYAQSWAVTHWFMSDPERRGRFMRYMNEVAQGADLMGAFNRATGMDPNEFQRQLRRYVGGRLTYSQAPASAFVPVGMTVTELPASADQLLLLNQRQKGGLTEEQRQETLRLIRTRATRHTGDPFAMLVLGHAELHIGDADVGERLLTELLAIEPDNEEALQLLASRRYRQARDTEDRAEQVRLLNEGNAFLRTALDANPDDYRTYYWLAMNRMGQPGYPNENDLETWVSAFDLAPQLSEVRFGLGQTLMFGNRFEDAILILAPLANSPHGGEGRDYAAQLIELARQRQRPISFTDFEADDAAGVEGEDAPPAEE